MKKRLLLHGRQRLLWKLEELMLMPEKRRGSALGTARQTEGSKAREETEAAFFCET